MKKGFKYLATFVVLVLIFAASAGLLLMTMVNSDWVKTQIRQYAKTSTGRDLIIKGSLHASFWPQFGISVNDVSLSNPSGFGDEPFLSAKKLTINAEFMPLLHHQLSVNHANLSDAVINLQKNRQGQTNWTFKSNTGQSQNIATAEEAASQNIEQNNSMQFNIEGISLAHSTINYTDALTDKHLSVQEANLTSSDIQLERPFPIKGTFTFINGKGKPTTIKLDTLVGYNAKSSTLTLNNLDLQLKPTNLDEVSIKGKVVANLTTSTINISALNFAMSDLKLTGTLTGRNLRNNPVLSGLVSSNNFNLRKLLNSIGQPLAIKNTNSLTEVQINGDLQLSTQGISLKILNSTIDGQAIRGEMNYVLSPAPRVGFILITEELLVENFLPGGGYSESEKGNTSALQAKGESSHSLVIDGSLAAQRLAYGVYRLSGVKTNIHYANKQLNLQNFSAGLFSGRTVGNISINFKDNAPLFAINQTMTGIRAEEMLRTMVGSSKLSGVANVNLNIRAAGSSGDAIKRNIAGAVSFNVGNGVIAGTDIDYKIDQAIAKYAQRTARLSDRGRTPFTHLSGSVNLAKGNATSHDLEFLTPTVRVQASGTHNFISDSLDYKLNCRLLQAQAIDASYLGVNINTDLSLYDIPAKIGCTLQNPCVNVDMLGVMKLLATEGAKNAAKAVVQKELLKHVDENIGKNIGDTLGKIFSH
jgi:AsmA protein